MPHPSDCYNRARSEDHVNLDAIWDDTKDALSDAYRDLVGLAIAAVEAIVIVVAATFVSRWLRRRARHALAATDINPNVTTLAVNAVGIGVYVLAATVVLGVLGANWTALLAVLGAGTLAISLALQDVLKNFVAGVYLLLERPFTIGDRVRIRDIDGTVESIDIRTTVLRNLRDERVLVPNATVFAEILTNRSGYNLARTTVTLTGVTTPLDQLPAAVRGAVAGLDGLRDGAPRTTVTGAGGDGTSLTVSVSHDAKTDLTSDLIARLRQRFPEATVAGEAE